MHMIVDMIHTVAPIPSAFGAVPELQIRIVRIRPAADTALVQIACPLLGLSGRLLEVDGLMGVLVLELLLLPPQRPQQTVSEEDEVVENCQNGQQRHHVLMLPHHPQHLIQQEDPIQISQPLHPYRYDVAHEHLHIRKQGCKGQKQGQVGVVHTGGHSHTQPIQRGQEPYQNGQQDAGEIEDVESGRSPLLLHTGTDEVVKVGADGKKENVAAGLRHENERDHPPDLSLEDIIRHKGQDAAKSAPTEQVHHVNSYVANDHPEDQIGDAEPWMAVTEAIDRLVDFFHEHDLQNCA